MEFFVHKSANNLNLFLKLLTVILVNNWRLQLINQKIHLFSLARFKRNFEELLNRYGIVLCFIDIYGRLALFEHSN